MADNKKMVEAITSRDEDFAKWYTDIVKKAELVDYSGVKGCMVIRPYGYAIWELRRQATRMSICLCLSPKAFSKRKRITSRASLPNARG